MFDRDPDLRARAEALIAAHEQLAQRQANLLGAEVTNEYAERHGIDPDSVVAREMQSRLDGVAESIGGLPPAAMPELAEVAYYATGAHTFRPPEPEAGREPTEAEAFAQRVTERMESEGLDPLDPDERAQIELDQTASEMPGSDPSNPLF